MDDNVKMPYVSISVMKLNRFNVNFRMKPPLVLNDDLPDNFVDRRHVQNSDTH